MSATALALAAVYTLIGILGVTTVGLSAALVRLGLPASQHAGAGLAVTGGLLTLIVAVASIASSFYVARRIMSVWVLGLSSLVCFVFVIAGAAGLAPPVGSPVVKSDRVGVHRAALAVTAVLATILGLWSVVLIFAIGVHVGLGTASMTSLTPVDLLQRAFAGNGPTNSEPADVKESGDQSASPSINVLPPAQRALDGRFVAPSVPQRSVSTSSTYSEMKRGVFGRAMNH